MTEQQLAAFPLWYAAFLLSLTCHEASHALVAKWGGDLTAYNSGQVTLNPLPHIRREPFGTVLVPVIMYLMSGSMLGWASAPYDPSWERRYPKRAALMALAGPVANFLLAIVAVVLIRFVLRFAIYEAGAAGLQGSIGGGTTQAIFFFLNILFRLNLLLGCFNLMPFAPLDGHTAIGLLMPDKTFERWLGFIRSPMISLIGLLIAWRIMDYIFVPILALFPRLL